MLFKKKLLQDMSDADQELTPMYSRHVLNEPIPRYNFSDNEILPRTAYSLIHDELMLEGNSRLNLATFVTTWMEPEAGTLMAETFDKNMIDKDEYPQTAALRCAVSICLLTCGTLLTTRRLQVAPRLVPARHVCWVGWH